MPSLSLLDLSPHLETADFRELLLFLVGWHEDDAANQRAADRAIQEYRTNLNLRALGLEENGQLLGMIGLERIALASGIIRHIVVHPASRGKGIGCAMIAEVITCFKLEKLTAETDREAVAFYRRCGFESPHSSPRAKLISTRSTGCPGLRRSSITASSSSGSQWPSGSRTASSWPCSLPF
ncbi:MAG: hypothetical protein C4331_05020 [Meiothermus sp.]